MARRVKIAVIGAGLAGLCLARRLREQADVTLFEKSRGFGGRMSTRRAAPFHFDHGAQYFTAKGADFQDFLAPFVQSGTVAAWSARMVALDAGTAQPIARKGPLYVAVPAMNSLCKALADGLDVALATRVARLHRVSGRWTLEMTDGTQAEGFDWVVSTAPAEQTRALLPNAFAHHDALARARTLGCFTLMLGYDTPLSLPWDAARPGQGPLAWLAVNSTKPGREPSNSLVLQSANDWAETHMEDDPDKIEAQMLTALHEATGLSDTPAYKSLHRWRFAAVDVPAGKPFLLDADNGLAAAGDWCLRGRVEAAFDSGTALGSALAARL